MIFTIKKKQNEEHLPPDARWYNYVGKKGTRNTFVWPIQDLPEPPLAPLEDAHDKEEEDDKAERQQHDFWVWYFVWTCICGCVEEKGPGLGLGDINS